MLKSKKNRSHGSSRHQLSTIASKSVLFLIELFGYLELLQRIANMISGSKTIIQLSIESNTQ